MIESSFLRDIEWIRRHMPRTRRAVSALPDLAGVRLACNMHLDPKMYPFIHGLMERGAAVHLTTCNTGTVSDPLIERVGNEGAQAVAKRGMSRGEWAGSIVTALEWEPTHLCEMGAELTSALFGTNPLLPGRRLIDEGAGSRVIAGMEATGSGINRLRELTGRGERDGTAAEAGGEPGYPVINWDDVPVKEGLHNRHMVGITAWHTFFQRTGLTLHGKRVVVVGYGSVGRGVADAARAYGGSVVVAEPDAGRGLEAQFAGYAVGRLPEVAAGADVVVTATGHPGVVNLATVRGLAEGAFLLNVGHIDYEIDTESMAPFRGEEVIPFVREYEIDGKAIYLFAEGAMANLSAGRGDSINAFDVTLAVMTATVGYMVETDGRLAPGVRTLPSDVWRRAVEGTAR